MRTRTVPALVLGLGLAVTATACGGDDDGGGENGGAPPDRGGLAVTSAAFGDGDAIPERYTCDGDDVSPPLSITGLPAGTAEIAVVVRDPDAGGFVHWVVAGLPGDTAGLDEGTLPAGAIEADNGFGEPGWAGPCPPEGEHTYEFTVYALGEPSGLEAGAEAGDGVAAVEAAAAEATATLRGTYERP